MNSRLQRFIKLSIPITVVSLLFQAFDLVDLFFIGQLGKEAIATAGFALTVFSFVLAPLDGFFESVTILAGEAYGVSDYKRLHALLYHALLLALGLGIISIMFFFPLSAIMGLLLSESEMLEKSQQFLGILCLAFVPTALNLVLSRFLLVMHHTREYAGLTLITMICNILFDWLFIFGHLGFPAFGVVGAAIAMLTARIFSAIFILSYLKWITVPLFLGSPAPKINRQIFWNLAKTGFPMAQAYFLEVSAWAVFISTISHLGVVPMAAHIIGMRIKDIGYIFGAGAASMTTVQVAHAIARNDAVGAKKESSLAACWAVIMMEGVSILALVFSPLVIGIFSNDTEVIATSTTILRIHILYQACDAIFMIYRAALVGLNDTLYVRNISLLGGWFVMIPVSLLLTNIMSFGVVGAWLGLTLNVSISAIFYAGRFHFKLRDGINN